MDSLEKVGRVAKPFGRDGELIVNLYDTFPEDYDTEEPLFANIDSLTVPLFFDKFERRGQRSALVRFADFDTDIRAAELIGKELFVKSAPAASCDEDDEIYFEDLVGFTVSFDDSSQKGVVTAYIDNDLNPLFEVSSDGRMIYIPAVEEMISALDTDRREIEFSLPEGLLELYL